MKTLQELRNEGPHWSFSSLNSLLNICGLQWAFQRLYHEAAEFTPLPLAFGGVFHDTCTHMALLRMTQQKIVPGEILQLFADLFVDEVRRRDPPVRFNTEKNEDLETLVDQGQRMLQTLIDHVDPEEEVLGFNVPFKVHLRDVNGVILPLPLIGEFDLVVRKGGLTVIVDWKTSSQKWSAGKEHHDDQATCYTQAYLQQHRERPAFRFDVVTKAKTPTYQKLYTARDEEDTLRLAEYMHYADRIVANELFIPVRSFYCAGCPYQTACAQWHHRRTRVLSLVG